MPLLETFDWAGFFLLFDPDGRIAGTVSAEVAPDLTAENGFRTGRLGSPGIVPEHRSAELYQALLASGVAYLKARNVVMGTLETWGEDQTTIDAYQQLGFGIRSEQLAYTRDL